MYFLFLWNYEKIAANLREMNYFAIAISLLGISAIFVSFEIFLRPEIFDNTAPEFHYSSNSSETEVSEPKANDFFETGILDLNGLPLSTGFYGTAIFRLAPITENDDFVVVSFPFGHNTSAHGIVTRIVPKREMSSGRLFSLVRDKLSESIPPEDRGMINITPPLVSIVGAKANFYIDDKKTFPNTTFLVIRGDKKVLAFEYERQYHEAVKNSIPLFLQ